MLILWDLGIDSGLFAYKRHQEDAHTNRVLAHIPFGRTAEIPAVFIGCFYFVLGPLPRGSWGRVRTVNLLRELVFVGRFRPESGGSICF